MKKIKISAVSYTNSKPFIYGLERSSVLEKIDLSLDIPSDCAEKLINGTVDVGLVPVAALLKIPGYQIVSNYCIGASQAVNSVFIFSDVPVGELKTLRLDKQSRTSNNLARVLLKHYWRISPQIVECDPEADGFVEIGDRTFGKTQKFPYVYDLAEEWIKFTGLPFAFAVWAANKPLPPAFIEEFDAALKLGVDNRREVLKEIPQTDGFDLEDYMMNRIDFVLDAEKKQAIAKFLGLVQDL